jgi:hypothetical protein
VLSVSGAGKLEAVATRNGYADFPVVNVYSSAGFPLVPWTPRNVSGGGGGE